MNVYRLQRKKYKIELSGIGASKAGGRWNSKGIEIIYTAQNRALAMAEILVHLSVGTMPNDFVMIEIDIPKSIKIKHLTENELPLNWNVFPLNSNSQKIGNDFIRENKFCVLRIPSSIVKEEYNLLINPNHKDFKKIKIVNSSDFTFDSRLF
jgi:RES domain-containing protein